jgi:thymidylate synthase ThyX
MREKKPVLLVLSLSSSIYEYEQGIRAGFASEAIRICLPRMVTTHYRACYQRHF